MGPGGIVLVVAICAGAGALSCVGTRLLIPLLQRRGALDRPNRRSSHTVPVPRGGGIALIGAIVAAWLTLTAAGAVAPAWLAVAAGGVALALVSWADDLRPLSPGMRLLAQAVAVALGTAALPTGAVFQGWLPPALDVAAAALVWVWFVNLFNFMDGIDGIAGSEAAAIGVGLMLVALLGIGADRGIAALGATVAAAAAGFLVWNWAPARIFMGDVGSVPLGYLLGFLLLAAAAAGAWKLAVILPLYFLADATITLLRRLLRGARVWQAHREHFYQRAVQAGLSHDAVVGRVIAADLLLIACAGAAENGAGVAALGLAAAIVAGLLAALSRPRRAA